jgi:thioredoxin-like negative regulator of GroEL
LLFSHCQLRQNLAAARVDTTTEKFADARSKITPVLTQASKSGNFLFVFDARLALAEVALKSGQVAAGRAQLSALEKDARAKGFLLVARKARELAGSQSSLVVPLMRR